MTSCLLFYTPTPFYNVDEQINSDRLVFLESVSIHLNDAFFFNCIGTKGRTEKALLCHMLKNDFERGTKDSYYIDLPAIGDIKYIKLQLIGGKITIGSRDWHLRNLVIFDLKAHKMVEIPCYRWISDRITLMPGSGRLSQIACKLSYSDDMYVNVFNIGYKLILFCVFLIMASPDAFIYVLFLITL